MRMMKIVELDNDDSSIKLNQRKTKKMDQDLEETPDKLLDQGVQQDLKTTWRSLFDFTTPRHGVSLLIAVFFSLASGLAMPIMAVFLGRLFNSFTTYGGGGITATKLMKQVTSGLIALVGLGFASWILKGLFFVSWVVFGELQAKNARNKLFGGMLLKDLEWYDMRKNGVSALIPRLNTQIRELQISTSHPLGLAVQYTVTALASLGLAFYESWSVTLVTLSTLPIGAGVLAFLSRRTQPKIYAQSAALGQASKLANNAISNIDTVKYFNGQEFECRQYSTSIKRAARYYLQQAKFNALQIGIIRFLTLSLFVQAFWYGEYLVRNEKSTAGRILTTFWACLLATESIEMMLPQLIVLEKGRAAGATLKATLLQIDRGRRVVTMAGQHAPLYCDGDIEVRNISFAYPARLDHHVLEQANFFFPAGETTFVIGKSGSGKSTLGNLLMRFYPPTVGEILIDGNPIQTIDINWLRNNITLIQQSSILFNESIFKNIAFGRKDYTKVRMGDMKACVQLAMLQETINELPDGLDTVVGTGGSAMSGGQRQRVAIARARLRDTPILILDESTSALDHISRTKVMEAIRAWRRGKTTIIITHDISQIRENDFTYVIQNGKVVQEGFRHTLEKVRDGPFTSTFLNPEVKSSYTGDNQDIEKTLEPCESSLETMTDQRNSHISDDSMDIQIAPRNLRIPEAVFQRASYVPDSMRVSWIRRPSSILQTPFSPLEPSFNRMSLHSVRVDELRRPSSAAVSHPRKKSISLSAVSELGYLETNFKDKQPSFNSPFEVGSTSTQRAKRASNISISPSVRLPSPRSFKIPSRRKRKLTREEKALRILPIRKILATVWPTLPARSRILLVLGFLFAFLHAAATPFFSWIFSRLLATFFSGDSNQALVWSLCILGVAIFDGICSYLWRHLLEYCGQVWVDQLRSEAVKRMLAQPRSWFELDKNILSRLIGCLDQDGEEMRDLVGRFAGYIFVAAAMVVIAIVWSLTVSWKLTLVGLASTPFIYAILTAFTVVSGKWEGRSNDAGDTAGAIFTETFVNIRTVRALTLESYFHKKYTIATEEALKVGLKRSAYSGFFYGFANSGMMFVIALTFYYAAILVTSNEMSVQSVMTVVSLLLFSISGAQGMIAFVPQISISQDTATRLLRLANLSLHASHETSGTIKISTPGEISFRNLTFTYPSRPGIPALSNFTLTIPPHTCTAIVGASGSGKSTLASLLLDMYPISNDNPLGLTFSSRPIHTLHTQTLRSLIAIVPQQTPLFPATISENIAYGLPSSSPLATSANIRAAAVAAGIDEFICSLPRGYSTSVGDGSLGLSGGQIQRLGIARAIVRRPQILILDEATSSLDVESAALIRNSVKGLTSGANGKRSRLTVIIITHSREMMSVAENIVVVERGRCIQMGAYEKLIRSEGPFRRLIQCGEVDDEEWVGC
ncbi:MAG: hypothetical protein M1834_007895 [Cirrosporium novae-zelandiae]|nr:MAG: hypothetical protein M1834_007895 [Cirrosporium novae-zelandiae]